MKKVAVVGSRNFPNVELVRYYVLNFSRNTQLVSGGGGAVDLKAEETNSEREESPECKIFHADWDTHGRAAGPIRNSEIADYADEVIAFWDRKTSRGTFDCVKKFFKKKKKIEIIDPKGNEISIEEFFDAHKKRK